MLEDHPALVRPLGAGCAHVVLAEDIEHRGTGEAGDQRRIDDAERHGRQHEVVQPLQEGRIRAAITGGREPARADREDLDEHQPQPEARHACRHHGEGDDDLVEKRAAPDGGEHADRQRDRHRDEDREQRQEEGRFGARGERLRHRLVQEDRLAEITPEDAADELPVLHDQRRIQPHPRAQLRNVFRGRIRPQHDRCGVARGDPDDDENHRHDEGKHDQHASQPVQKSPGNPRHGLSPHFFGVTFQKCGQ